MYANKFLLGFGWLDLSVVLFPANCCSQNVCNAAKILQRLEAFTRSSVKVDASRGGAFVLFNGNVTGKFQELVGHSGKIYVFYVQQ